MYRFYRSDWDPVARLGTTGSGFDIEAHPGPLAFPASHSVVDYVADPAFMHGLRIALDLIPPDRDPRTPRDGVGRLAATTSGRPTRRQVYGASMSLVVIGTSETRSPAPMPSSSHRTHARARSKTACRFFDWHRMVNGN